MPQFIFWCAFEHLEFRLPEFEAIAELFNINLTWIDRNQSHPWVIIELGTIHILRKDFCSTKLTRNMVL